MEGIVTTTATPMSDVSAPADRAERGRAARRATPRSSQGEWITPGGRSDPVEILLEQAKTRVVELVPVRHQRMLASPFSFYRGAAAIMAADLASTPTTGIRVQCCGDAHLANFGGFEAPDRRLVFDINDFDETLSGPWEWDVKRLAASFAIAAQDREFDETVGRQAVLDATMSYREAMRTFAGMTNLDVWYARLDVEDVLARWGSDVPTSALKRVDRNVAKARTKNSLKALAKLTERVDGQIRIANDPPLVVRLHDLVPADVVDQLSDEVAGWVRSYSHTLQDDRKRLLANYQMVDIARKVVGVGSVGTRCWIGLMLGKDESDPLFLQIKEAEGSVLEPFAGKSVYDHHGQRVVEGQRLMQAASDIFLGWDQTVDIEGVERQFYIRQLWDGKVSADLATMPAKVFPIYGRLCGWTLARAHARSGDRIAIAAYLGAGDVFDRAIADFAFRYAAQNADDYAAVSKAAQDGRISVAT
jgi:uncharacterized protein (DUF2252 family)